MPVEIACNCGWRCKASEQYTGDTIDCPQCGATVKVVARGPVPYGYAPYSTWQKKVPKLVLPLVRPAPVLRDPFAPTAFWAGVASLLLVLTGCGIPAGLAFAPFSLRAGWRSRKWRISFGMPASPKSAIGVVFSLGALLLCVFLLASLIDPTSRRHHRPCTITQPKTASPEPKAKSDTPLRYQPSDQSQQELHERMRRYEANKQAWEAEAKRLNQRYPVEPQRTPVVPRNEFEQKQADYSESVRQQRAQGK